MASSSSHDLDDMMDEAFDQFFEQQFEKLSIHYQERQNASKSKKREPTLKDNENKETCGYGTIILVKIQRILLTCSDAILE